MNVAKTIGCKDFPCVDVAIKSLNYIAKSVGEKRVIPAGSTYKIRGDKYYFKEDTPEAVAEDQLVPTVGVILSILRAADEYPIETFKEEES